MQLDEAIWQENTACVGVTLDFDEEILASLPLQPGERERHMQIELACRFYASGWLTLAQGAHMAALDHYAFGVALAERGIPRQYGLTEALEDVAPARGQTRGDPQSGARPGADQRGVGGPL